MHPDTQTFVTSLFGRCQIHGQAAFITLTAIHPDGVHATPSRHIPVHHPLALQQALERLAEANRVGWGACVAIATRKANLGRWSRGGKGDLATLPALFVDVDFPKADTIQNLADFTLPPSCLIGSGHGYHAYWYLVEPTRSFAAAERALRGLALCFDADPALSSAQSMRLPGTVNTKPGRNVLCHLLDHHPERRYRLDDFRPYMTPAPLPHERTLPTLSDYRTLLDRDQIEAANAAIERRLLADYGGFWKRNGWLAAACPWTHQQDRPGRHFAYQPNHHVGFCFGAHGKRSLDELCQQLGIGLPV